VHVPKTKLRKLADIVRLIVRYGGVHLFSHASADPELADVLPDLKVRPAGDVQEQKLRPTDGKSTDDHDAAGDPERLADELEALGPTYIKLGQLLSTRGDLLPAPYLTALSRLQNDVKPIPFREVRRIVAAELGRPISKAFREFDREPVAAASLAQVHRARLHDGRRVAVKIQRPTVRAEIDDDLSTLQRVAELLDAHTEFGNKYDFKLTLEQFRKSLLAELDFAAEAQHLALFRQNLRTFDAIVIPEPIASHTTARMLTMEYVRGRKVTEADGRTKFDGANLAEQLFSAYLQQMLVDGVFHADPHPGNVLITPDGRLALIDLGMIGHISPALQEQMLKLMLAASEGEADAAADVAIAMSEARKWFDEPTFRRQMSDVILKYRDAPLKEIPVGRVVVDITRIAVENGLRVVPELTLVAKTLLNIDDVGRALDPDFDPNYALRRNASRLIQQRMLQAVSPAHVFTTALETKDFVQQLPARANRILGALAKNDLRFKMEMIDEGNVMDGLQKVANRIALGLVLAALILGAALLMQVHTAFTILGYPGLAMLFFIAAVIGGVWLSATILLTDRTRARRES
jgi:ubiquinone biosynthesis protein